MKLCVGYCKCGRRQGGEQSVSRSRGSGGWKGGVAAAIRRWYGLPVAPGGPKCIDMHAQQRKFHLQTSGIDPGNVQLRLLTEQGSGQKLTVLICRAAWSCRALPVETYGRIINKSWRSPVRVVQVETDGATTKKLRDLGGDRRWCQLTQPPAVRVADWWVRRVGCNVGCSALAMGRGGLGVGGSRSGGHS